MQLVGAGPGDAGLLTRRGEECLQQAEVVLADALVSAGVIALANPGAEIVTRRHAPTDAPGARERDQRALIDRMIAEARAGRRVVRLKGGDPSIFGRGAEEADALLAAGVPVEVIPGVTAASAASALAGVPLTHRDHAGAVCFVTGHEAGRRDGGMDLATLAAFPGTRVFYMARGRLRRLTTGLIDAGLPPETPAAVVSRAATGDQRTVCGTTATIADDCDAADLPGPAVLIVGETATDPGARGWWARRPLHGLTVACVRAEGWFHEPEDERLRELGASVIPSSLLGIKPPASWGEVDAIAADLASFEWVVFTSRKAVGALFRRWRRRGGDARRLAGTRMGCVGPSTAAGLSHWRMHADLVPETHDAESLAAALAPHVAGKRVLWATCPEAKPTLADRLTAAGAEVIRVHVYRQAAATELPAGFAARLDAGAVDWALIASGNLARTFAELSRDSPGRDRVRVAAISENVAAVCREVGLNVAATATEATWDGLVAALLRAVAGGRAA